MHAAADFRRRTNIDELVAPAAIDPRLPQPAIGQPEREPFRLPFRTIDPFQAQHYFADMAAALASRRFDGPVVIAAWLFLAAPAFVAWLVTVETAIGIGRSLGAWGTIGALLELVLATAIAGFWPWLLRRRSRRAA